MPVRRYPSALRLLAATMAACSVLSFAPPAIARPSDTINIVEVKNASEDAFAWMTVYAHAGSGIIKAFCVDPGQLTREGIPSSAYEVRAEVMTGSCRGQKVLDQLRGYPSGSGHTYRYYIHGSHGRYSYNNTP